MLVRNKSGAIKWLVPPKNIDPVVWFTPESWLAIETFVALVSTECHWYCTIHHNIEENYYIIDNFYIPEQEVSGTTVETSPQEYSKLVNEIKNEFVHIEDLAERFDAINSRVRPLTCWGHSHVNMQCVPSSTDEQNNREWIKGLIDGGNPTQPFAMMIVNKAGDVYLRITHPDTKVSFENPPIKLLMHNPHVDYIKEAIEKKIRKKTYTAYNVNSFNTTGGYNSADYNSTHRGSHTSNHQADLKKNENETALTTTSQGSTTNGVLKKAEDSTVDFSDFKSLITKHQLALSFFEKKKYVLSNLVREAYPISQKDHTSLVELLTEATEKINMYTNSKLELNLEVLLRYIDILDDMLCLQLFDSKTDAHTFLQTFKGYLHGPSPKHFNLPENFLHIVAVHPIMILLPPLLAILDEQQDLAGVGKISDMIYKINMKALKTTEEAEIKDWERFGYHV